MLLQAANAKRGNAPATTVASRSTPGSSLLLTESQQAIGGAPPLMGKISTRERGMGVKHDGIYLIESGRIRVFYTSPQGREITLAYWHVGNFVGGPEVFGTGIHQWSGVASSNA